MLVQNKNGKMFVFFFTLRLLQSESKTYHTHREIEKVDTKNKRHLINSPFICMYRVDIF